MKKSIKFLMTTVALTAGVLAFSKAESKAAVVDVAQTPRTQRLLFSGQQPLEHSHMRYSLARMEIQTGLLWRQHQVQMKV